MSTTTHIQAAKERHHTLYLRWWQVKEIADEAGISAEIARKIVSNDESSRRILPGCVKPHYVRARVLELFAVTA